MLFYSYFLFITREHNITFPVLPTTLLRSKSYQSLFKCLPKKISSSIRMWFYFWIIAMSHILHFQSCHANHTIQFSNEILFSIAYLPPGNSNSLAAPGGAPGAVRSTLLRFTIYYSYLTNMGLFAHYFLGYEPIFEDFTGPVWFERSSYCVNGRICRKA